MSNNKLKIVRNLSMYGSIIFLLVIIFFGFGEEIRKNNDIIIGFSAQLTGGQAELGVQQRDGAQLAVEEINESGGIAGRKISLIISDDHGIPEEAQFVDHKLIRDGAVAIIGHTTSTQTLAGLKVTNPDNIIMISPNTSTPALSGLDDYFFRNYPSFKTSVQAFAKHIYEDDKITNMAIIYDTDNLEYSNAYALTFLNEFEKLGGEITHKVDFSSRSHPDFSKVVSKLSESEVDGLLIVASDEDTASIAQKTRLEYNNISMFASAWAQTENLISKGGKAVEGIEIEQAYKLNSQSSAFSDFKSRYKARFGNEPSFGAAYSYEATLILAEALKKTNGNKDGLKQRLLEMNNFNGLTDNFSFDEFGDVERPQYLSTINNGKFIIIDELSPQKNGGE